MNTYVVETFNFNVSKTWVGEALDKITFDLYQNKTKVGTYILDDSNHWNMDFKHYPKTDEYGILLEYEIIESAYIDYDSTIEKIGDHFIITNTQIIEELPDPEDKPEAELPDDKDPDKELPDIEDPEVETPEETPVDKPVDEFKPEMPERAEDETPLDNPKDQAPTDTDKGPDHGGSILPGTGVSNPSFGVAMGLLIVGFIFIRRSRMKKQ